MKRKFFLSGLAALLLLLTTGCWNRRELNDLAIEVAIGIDKAGKRYRVTSQVVDPSEVAAQKGGGARAPVIMYQATADSPFEARRKMTTLSPRKIYAGHVRTLIVGEELARSGIGKILDYMSRDHEHRPDFYILVAKGTTAENILKVLTPLEKIPANKLYSSLQTSEKAWAPTSSVTLDQLITEIVSKGKDPVLTGLQVIGNPNKGSDTENVEKVDRPARLQLSNLGVFRGDKLLGWLNETESKGYNYITGNVKSTVGHLPCRGGGIIVFEVIRTKSKMKGHVRNGEPRVDVHLDLEANVGEVECKIDLMNPGTFADLEKRSNKRVKSMMEKAIKTAQHKYRSDIFGFGEAIHRADPKYWKQVEDRWDQKFTDLPVNVTVNVKIRRVGSVGEPFLNKQEE
ncbi:Ger(x)C family spore germination protein [Paenibacillus beijingensis]|uniref:Spore gernimation protein GerC n=1 Tax=Paenibacillus beijingensis TaxID=1126833 RepID=A0A0D5NID0_9BACL|nr:Ger(x)C family spore germination protein [Paenibacillus beijingensis]AJY75119.1 spore gernimation protein GerC [Paenibacillus beijingensis]